MSSGWGCLEDFRHLITRPSRSCDVTSTARSTCAEKSKGSSTTFQSMALIVVENTLLVDARSATRSRMRDTSCRSPLQGLTT